MARALPPLATLRAFAAAGRAESVAEAARALSVTPSSVSHQVRAMEDWIGAPLFDRGPRQIRLTPAGRALSDRLNAAFAEIETAVMQATAGAADPHLRISALPLFVSVWLAPRLHRFEAAYPNVSLDVDTSSRVLDFDHDPVDVAIRNVTTPTPGLAARKLLDLRGVVLCAPATAARLRTPADLAGETLIHISGRPGAWAAWLADEGCAGLKPRSNLSFEAIPAALEAAAQGRGVALGLDPLVRDGAFATRLATPFGPGARSAGAYFLVHRRADRRRPAVAAFVDWITREMRADVRRLWRLPLGQAAETLT